MAEHVNFLENLCRYVVVALGDVVPKFRQRFQLLINIFVAQNFIIVFGVKISHVGKSFAYASVSFDSFFCFGVVGISHEQIVHGCAFARVKIFVAQLRQNFPTLNE